MITKKNFGHAYTNIAKVLKNIEDRILVSQNNIEGLKGDIIFLKDILDDLHNSIYEDLKSNETND